jgi:alginate O-acetyltransferase complex protein AlgI
MLAIYSLSPARFKNITLLIFSLVFYGYGEIKYLWIMAVVILINYTGGLLIDGSSSQTKRKVFLTLSVCGSLSLLFYFKYAYFFASNLNLMVGIGISKIETVILPLGISFYTFQSISYVIDVYRRDVQCERNIINFGAYVVMFPQLIAGPVVRYSDISERLHILKSRVTAERIDKGIELFVFGLAKKVLLADGVNMLWTDIIGRYSGARLADEGIGLANASTPLAWLCMLAYSLYIYHDFSGYSLMGIGLGKMIGFDFPNNFDLPYTSRSVTEFWRRWHITLSSWFREYVYIPLGGNRKGVPRQILNIFIVWLLTGFWHGANWNFMLWGLYYCVFLIIEKLFLLKALKKARIWPRLYTTVIVVIGWAIFASSDPGVGFGLLFKKLFYPQGGVSALYFARNYLVIIALAVLFSGPIPYKLYNRIKHIQLTRVGILLMLFIACVAYMVDSGYKPFLYFNF